MSVKISGLTSGHSGADIHRGRASAIELLAPLADEALRRGARVARARGGGPMNAIPAAAEAEMLFLSQKDKEDFKEYIKEYVKETKHTYRHTDPDL